jgi:UDP-glucuronate decarboxylase
MRRKALVTGGCGFIGSHLIESLLGDGYEVYCLDNMSTGSTDNLAHLFEPSGSSTRLRIIEGDVTEPYLIPVDEIYNLACPASPASYQADPIATWKASVLGALHALGAAKWAGAKVLQASTSEVYGDPATHPQDEAYYGNVNPVGPRACYDEGKRAAEAIFFDHMRTYGTDIKVVRIFNTYGPRMSLGDGRVVVNFIVRGLLGKPLEVYGTGSQTRSLCYISDTVKAIRLMMATGAAPGPVNIGNPYELSVRDIAYKIVRMIGTNSQIVLRPEEAGEDDPLRRRPDISLARELLHWGPKISLGDGLRETIEYYRGKLAPHFHGA